MDKTGKQTEWELQKNVIGLCKECSDKKRANWQMENKGLKINIGDFVKIGVEDKGEVEHLWFEVIKKTALGNFVGRCDNTPVVIENIRYNDYHKFKFRDVEEYLSK